jgi:hypothetical protein
MSLNKQENTNKKIRPKNNTQIEDCCKKFCERLQKLLKKYS